jgi:hypothetical protein
MSGVFSPLDPLPVNEVVDIDIIQPDVRKILTTDNKKTVCSDRGEMRISSFGGEGIRTGVGEHRVRRSRRDPALGCEIKDPDVIQDTQIFGGERVLSVAHSTKYDKLIVPWASLLDDKNDDTRAKLILHASALWK